MTSVTPVRRLTQIQRGREDIWRNFLRGNQLTAVMPRKPISRHKYTKTFCLRTRNNGLAQVEITRQLLHKAGCEQMSYGNSPTMQYQKSEQGKHPGLFRVKGRGQD